MDSQLQEVVKQITDAVDKRLAKRFDEVETRLANGACSISTPNSSTG